MARLSTVVLFSSSSSSSSSIFSVSRLLLPLIFLSIASNFNTASASAATSSAFFVFGDSSVDPGNNNYINTIPENRANYEPYGHNAGDLFDQPTGRFSDGRIIVDYIAEYAGLAPIPAFLHPSAQYVNGANFASGGAGVLSETNMGGVIDLKTQLKHFEEVQKSLMETMGDDIKVKEVISEAVYFFSIGSNDYMGGYLGSPVMQQAYSPEQYVGMVIGNLTLAIQELYAKGGRKFCFLGLSPLGCLPALRALNEGGDGCLEQASALALAHNTALTAVLANLESLLKGFKYGNSNFYNWLEARINKPSNYGFKEGVNACCGSGRFGGEYTCGGEKKPKEYTLCDNANEYIWWDSYHPSERIHEQFAKALWNRSTSAPLEDVVGPYSLQNLFFMNKEKVITIGDVVDDPENEQSI